jgi:hypothetical protein
MLQLHVLRVHEVVPRKNDFLYDLCKNDKIGTKISLFMTYFLSFFAEVTKNIHFSMKLCMSKV